MRDSNPRTCNSQQFSRLPQSTTLPTLRRENTYTELRTKNFFKKASVICSEIFTSEASQPIKKIFLEVQNQAWNRNCFYSVVKLLRCFVATGHRIRYSLCTKILIAAGFSGKKGQAGLCIYGESVH